MKRILVSRLVSASVIVAVIGALTVAAVALPGSPFDDNPSTPGEVSGNCDEAEHANDPECGGSGAPDPGAPATDATPGDDPTTPVDISGNCDEPEHFGDPGCDGEGGNAATPGTQPPPSDDATTPVDISGNCDEAEHANDVECGGTGAISDDDDLSTPALAATGEVVAKVGLTEESAGTVSYSFDGTEFTVEGATPNADGGWTISEQRDGLKIEVRFVRGTVRVDVHIELEYGQVRERVRTRDRADDSETRFENDVLTRTEPGSDDSNSGPGSDDSGSDDSGSDDSGSGHGSDDSDS